MSSDTVFTAISYFDHFSDSGTDFESLLFCLAQNELVDIPQGALSLAAVGCLLLAAKWEEREEDVPLISTLTSVMNNEFSMKDLRTMEMIILDFKNWNCKFSIEHHPPTTPRPLFPQ